MWEMELIFLSILLIAINIGFFIGLWRYKISSVILYIAVLVNTIVIVLILTYLNVGSFVFAYEPYSPLNPFDVGLEYIELSAFIAIFCIALIARAKYPVIGGKGWNILLFAVVFGSIGMFCDVYGEYVNFASFFFPVYKLLTGAFQIAGIIGLALAFLTFYKFSEILFTPAPKNK
ncbi:MAG TPA: hypothetical protein VMV49_16365 [Candidatus Deferrimicrobium sp.]|nr:hypothetical protein [Candidatus Deferrimicrobium sp.]